ncbi:flavin-containing amine oxidoreductase-domain containing protein [Syncephalis fuscata]|nr:flavin-containing amine oxidoreductase-domain containing protein [Syncephalis fuscata]
MPAIVASKAKMTEDILHAIFPRPYSEPIVDDAASTIIGAVEDYQKNLSGQDVDDSNGISDNLSLRDGYNEWYKAAAEEHNVDPGLLYDIIDTASDYNGVELKKISLKHFGKCIEYRGPHYIVLDGMESVLREVVGQDVMDSVYTKHVVKQIEYTDKTVRVVTENHGEFIADAVIITVPLGVLKAQSIVFNPPLPDRKLKAINRLGFGLLDKIILEYENAEDVPGSGWQHYITVRPKNTTLNSKLDDDLLPPNAALFFNFCTMTNYPVLMIYLSGDNAKVFENKSDKEIADRVQRHLKHYFPDTKLKNPVRCTMSRWHQDKYAYGSYCYIPVNGDTDDITAIAEPCHASNGTDTLKATPGIPKQQETTKSAAIFWAGEHTIVSRYTYLDGAMLSGIRAAKELLDYHSVGH